MVIMKSDKYREIGDVPPEFVPDYAYREDDELPDAEEAMGGRGMK